MTDKAPELYRKKADELHERLGNLLPNGDALSARFVCDITGIRYFQQWLANQLADLFPSADKAVSVEALRRYLEDAKFSEHMHNTKGEITGKYEIRLSYKELISWLDERTREGE